MVASVVKPPLMMSGGIDFESQVFEQIRRNKSSRDLREGASKTRDDGEQVTRIAKALLAGDEQILLQPRLTGSVSGWSITGDVDILRLVRDGIVICEDAIASLKRFKDDAKEVAEGYECGITLQKFSDVKEGDVFECFKLEEYRD